jgi:hypothetical protein
MMSFIVESVSASEATEVLKARLTVIKNSLKVSDSKAETAKVDVGVAAGVGVGVDATKIAKGSFLQSQAKLAAKNVKTRSAESPVVPPVLVTAPQVPVRTTPPVTQVPSAQIPQAPIAPQIPQVSQAQVAPQVPQVPQVPQATQAPVAQVPQVPQVPQAQISQTQTSQAPVPQVTSRISAQDQFDVSNISAAIDEYVAKIETRVNAQMEAIQQAYAEYREASKDKMITYAAKLLTQLQDLEEAMKKANESRIAYEKEQNIRIEENKEVVKQFVAEAKQKAKEERQKMKDEIDNMVKEAEAAAASTGTVATTQTPVVRASYLQKQRKPSPTYYVQEQVRPSSIPVYKREAQPAILVSLNTNKLKQKLRN